MINGSDNRITSEKEKLVGIERYAEETVELHTTEFFSFGENEFVQVLD